MIRRCVATLLVILHIATFSPIREAFAFQSQSVSFKLSNTVLNEGGDGRSTATFRLATDAVGESALGRAQSASYILNAGYVRSLQTAPPLFNSTIPNQGWQENQSRTNAFDLDDYFSSPEGLVLTYSAGGTANINVSIDPATHLVSLSQPSAWYGTEKVTFTATDSAYNTVKSNEITLQVQGVNNPPVLDFIPNITVNECALVKITAHATDLDGDTITYTFSSPLNAQGSWQTGYTSAGNYDITVTATDTTGLKASQIVKVTVINVNRAPVLTPLPDKSVNEGSLVTVTPVATDPDNDALTFYYSAPLDSTGKWLTNYSSAGIYTVTVTVSDGISTVADDFKLTVLNVNRAPAASLTLDKYTTVPNDSIKITLSASDADTDAMSFVIKKDGVTIASGNISGVYTAYTSFSALGDHTISATVTDAGGLTAAASRGVSIVDPNASRDTINPLMGDFNGDSLTDLGLHNSQDGSWQICLSAKGVFTNAVNWLTGFGTTRDWWPMGGDFNGDGKSDIGIYNNTNGQLQVALSSGSGFSIQGTAWLTAAFASYSWQPFTGNFNGDKYPDFGLYNKDTGEIKMAKGTGSGFGAFETWGSGLGVGAVALSGDFNGDGLSDLCLFNKASGGFKVAFSNTKSFVDLSSWASGFAVNQDALLSDFNNDGLTDIGYWEKSSGKWNYAISTGAKFVAKGVWLTYGSSVDESASSGDFNGDGMIDAAVFDRDALGINCWKVKLSLDKPPDLLSEVNNGIGGKTQVAYTYAAESDNPGLPFPVYVTKSVKLIDTLPAGSPEESYTQQFSYFGGYYDAAEREFRGFAKVTVTDPITNNYSETYFYQGKPEQDTVLRGQIEKILAYDGNARKISESLSTYEVRKAGPAQNVLGYAVLKEQLTTVWEENGTSLSTKDVFIYDSIGNVLEAESLGDTAKAGDEKSQANVYAAAYEAGFNRVIETALQDKDGIVVTKKNNEYDDKGNLIREKVVIYNPLTEDSVLSTVDYGYDSYGNVYSTTNAKGSSVVTEYDPDSYTYPVKITNALEQSIEYTYDPKLGVVTSVTDTNGQTSSTTYDSFGRKIKIINANSQVVTTYSYPDFNTVVTTNAIGLSKTEYIDGIGRKYRTVSVGEDGSAKRNVSSEAYYNNRGLAEKESLAHYVDEDPAQISYSRYEYDIRGRIKKTIADFPGTAKDAESSINYLSPLYTETTDALGHRKGTAKDIYGNVIEVTEFTLGGVYKTAYNYDIQGNMVKLTDSKGNISQIYYDSLGRKIKMIDPDMGTWRYEYDVLGNLIRQVDAKGQILEFTYDALNRLTKKARDDARGTRDEVGYLYDATSKPNCIGRLSSVTDPSGSTEFYYDNLGREVKSIKTVSATQYPVLRDYDIADRLVKLTYPDGTEVKYGYDVNSGLLEKVFSPNSQLPTPDLVKDITYSAAGQMKAIKYGNDVVTAYTYGQDLRLSRIQTSNNEQQTTAFQDLNYVFDKVGNLVTLTDNLRSNVRNYVYDDLDRFTQANNVPAPGGGYGSFSYQYDSIGNMVYRSDLGVMTYGLNAGPHAMTSAGGYSYQYDANGNMITGKNKSLAYDAENRLVKVDQLGTITSYLYDGDGGRVQKAEVRGQTTETTTYIGSLFEVRVKGTGEREQVKHIFAGSTRVASVSLPGGEADEAISYYHGDHLGSSSVITGATGAMVQHCEYTPYGGLASNEGSDVVRHKFTGKELDSNGLYFYSARYYDPEIGRFISADTIVQAPYDSQSLNRYSYCRNNPINYIDPSGHLWFIPIIIGAIIGAGVGAASAAIMGGDIGRGALFGAISGALFAGVSQLAQVAMKFAVCGTANVSLIGGARVAANIISGVAGGAAAGAGGAAFMGGDVLKGAGIGALSGGVFSGIGGMGGDSWQWDLTRAGLAAAAGGGISELAGGDFGTGAAFSGIFAVSYGVYNRITGMKPTLDTAKKPGQIKQLGQAIAGAEEGQSNVGGADYGGKKSFLRKIASFSGSETGFVMNMASKYIPGLNPMSFMHDYMSQFIGNIFKGPFATPAFLSLTVPSIAPSYAITVAGAVFDTQPAMIGQFALYGEKAD